MRAPSWGPVGLGSHQRCPGFLLSYIAVAAAELWWPRGCRILVAFWGPSPPCPGPAANRGTRRAAAEDSAGKGAPWGFVAVVEQEVTSAPGAV